MYYCEKCYAVFSSENRLIQHLQRGIPCTTTFSCEVCNIQFQNKSNYSRHLKSKKHAQNVTIPAQNVTIPAQNVTIPAQNVTMHAQNVPPQYKCEKCDKEFVKNGNRVRHQQKCTGLQNPLQCATCLKVFSSRCSKSRHLKTINCTPPAENSSQVVAHPCTHPHGSTIQTNTNSFHTNSHNTVNTHIHINAFKEENIDYILKDVDKMNKYICSSLPGFQNLVKEIHFNDEHPENKNVRIKNIRSSLAEYFNCEKWIFENKKVLVEDLVNMCMAHIHKFLQTDEATDRAHQCWEYLNEWLESNDENIKTYQKIRNDTMFTIANNYKK